MIKHLQVHGLVAVQAIGHLLYQQSQPPKMTAEEKAKGCRLSVAVSCGLI